MNHGPIIFLGTLFTLLASWMGLVFGAHHQLNKLDPVKADPGGIIYPTPRPGAGQQGELVYKANGCVVCHTQQTSGGQGSTDIKRGWGSRRSVSRDLLYTASPQLGHIRLGPDLANVGARASTNFAASWVSEVPAALTNGTPEEVIRETTRVQRGQRQELINWHLAHLYNSQITSPGSTMPSYPFLFEKRKVGRNSSVHALRLPEKYSPGPDYEIIPKDQAYQLVDYILSLQASTGLYEAPVPQKEKPEEKTDNSTNAPAAATNAAGASNAPAPAPEKAK
jgi:cytochrome c oxidase cbb3-type subunit II